MPLTLAQMHALITDGGANTAADVRNVVTAIVHGQRGPHSVDNAADVWWEGNIGSFTTVSITGTETITEVDGTLSVKFDDQAANDLNCVLKAHTFSVGDSFAVRLRLFERAAENFAMAALVFADGASSTANAICTMAYYQETGLLGIFECREGTLTSMATADITLTWDPGLTMSDGVYLRLTYQAANTFRLHWSIDGVTWVRLGTVDVTFTLTPTHFGVGWSTWGGLTDDIRIVSFGPICKLA